MYSKINIKALTRLLPLIFFTSIILNSCFLTDGCSIDDTNSDPDILNPDLEVTRVKIGVVKVNLLDAEVEAGPGEIEQLLYDTDDLYDEASFGQMRLDYKFFDDVTIDEYRQDSCKMADWSAVANQQLDLTGLDVRIYIFAKSACNTVIGAAGGTRICIRAWDIVDIYAHEIGHTVGMGHSAIGDNKYADVSCSMGYGGVGLRHFNSPHKFQMGWILEHSVSTIDSSGTYTVELQDLESYTNGIQVVKIPTGVLDESYYISYRAPIGYDIFLRSQYLSKTNIHRWSKSTGNGWTYFLGALNDDDVYEDAGPGFTITQFSHDSVESVIEISYNREFDDQAVPESGSNEYYTDTGEEIDGNDYIPDYGLN